MWKEEKKEERPGGCQSELQSGALRSVQNWFVEDEGHLWGEGRRPTTQNSAWRTGHSGTRCTGLATQSPKCHQPWDRISSWQSAVNVSSKHWWHPSRRISLRQLTLSSVKEATQTVSLVSMVPDTKNPNPRNPLDWWVAWNDFLRTVLRWTFWNTKEPTEFSFWNYEFFGSEKLRFLEAVIITSNNYNMKY